MYLFPKEANYLNPSVIHQTGLSDEVAFLDYVVFMCLLDMHQNCLNLLCTHFYLPQIDSKHTEEVEEIDDGLLDLDNLDQLDEIVEEEEEREKNEAASSSLNSLRVSIAASQLPSLSSSGSTTPRTSMLQRPSNLRRPSMPARSASAQSSSLQSPVNDLASLKLPPNGFLSNVSFLPRMGFHVLVMASTIIQKGTSYVHFSLTRTCCRGLLYHTQFSSIEKDL